MMPMHRCFAMLTGLALAAPACATVHERRVGAPELTADGHTVASHVEQRKGKRVGTWKPYVAAAIVGAVVASSAMIWKGFLDANKPLSLAGTVLVIALPIGGAVPFLVAQDVPWARTKWSEWTPAPDVDARLDVRSDVGDIVRTARATSATDGSLHIELGDSLCRSGLALTGETSVDLELSVRRADESARASVPARQLGASCRARMSLLNGATR